MARLATKKKQGRKKGREGGWTKSEKVGSTYNLGRGTLCQLCVKVFDIDKRR